VKHIKLHNVKSLGVFHVETHFFCRTELKTLEYHMVNKNLDFGKGTIFKYEEESKDENY